jgi:GT2 family glycosyltransferase
MNTLACSVIIPSYNRQATLELVLRGLATQTASPESFEVIVVLDGSTDDSAASIAAWQQSGRLPNLRSHWQPNRGQAAARNAGAGLAQAPVLLFLDNDIVPEPDLLEAHLRWREHEAPLVVLGDCHIVRQPDDSLCHLGMWAWWEDFYYQRALPGHQPNYRDFCAGNASLRREDFLRAGGFDASFRGYGGEDYELGYRLLHAGVRFVADRKAQAHHHHRATVPGVLRMARQEARGDVLLGKKHPELRAGLSMARVPPGPYGLLVRLALQCPALGNPLMAMLLRVLPIFERAQMRRRWMEYFGHVRGYAYWRGVRDALGSWPALLDFQAGALPSPRHTLDIAQGLPQELPPFWMHGPATLDLTWQGQPLGELSWLGPLEVSLPSYLADQITRRFWAGIWARWGQLDTLPGDVCGAPTISLGEGHGL